MYSHYLQRYKQYDVNKTEQETPFSEKTTQFAPILCVYIYIYIYYSTRTSVALALSIGRCSRLGEGQLIENKTQ